jgi:DNA-binding transcriptional MocR family regulator
MGYKDREHVASLTLKHPSDKAVLLAIADHHNGQRGAWPSQRLLSQVTGLSTRTIRRALRRLEEAGHVVTEFRFGALGQRSSVYRIVKNQNERSSAKMRASCPPPPDTMSAREPVLEPKGPRQGEHQPIKVEDTREATAPATVALGTATGFGMLARFLARPTARIQGGRRHG